MAESDAEMSAAVPLSAGSEAHSPAPPVFISGEVDGTATATDPSYADLVEENALLREAVAARDAFLAVAAHELRNPMTPIVGRVERLRRLLRKPDLRPETLEKSLEQIAWLIAQYVKRATTLLDVSRVTTGQFKLDPAPTNLGDLVRDVVENFAPVADLSGASLTCQAPTAPLVRMSDRLALEQILDNLVSNAIKYGGGQPIVVSVSESEAGSVVLQVRDQGPGISAESQARIFERFERAVRPGQHRGGFGVGLWVVRQLIETMGGTVTISSRPYEGTTFMVTLPLPTVKDPE